MSDGGDAGLMARIGHNFNDISDDVDHEYMWDMMSRFSMIDANNLAFEKERARQKRIDEVKGFVPETYRQKYNLK